MHETQNRFNQIKADLERSQKDVYDRSCRDLHIPEGKRVYVKHPRGKQGQATRFIRRFDGPYIVLGHVRGRDGLLKLKHLNSGLVIKPVNVEKVVVVPEGDINDLQDDEIELKKNSDISKVAFRFGKYLLTPKNNCAPSSEACKYVYSVIPESREILSKHGKLKGFVKICPCFGMKGLPSGGVYTLHLEEELFSRI